MLMIEESRRELKANILDRSADLVASVLPRVDGHGLTQAECFRLNRAENTARAAYAQDCPEADSIEIHRVGAAAAKDALRTVLRDRPAAPCCDALEAVPCLGCAAETLPTAAASIDPGDVESDPETWGPEWDNWFWTSEPDDDDDAAPEAPEPRLTLAELIDSEAARLRRMETDAGDLMADALRDLARIVRTVDALRPDQVWERVSILDRDFSEPVEYVPELTAAGRWA